MAEVAGRYNCNAEIGNSEYTFTGNNRDALFSPTGDNQRLTLVCSQNPLIYLPRQYDTGFVYGTKVFIKRARVISRGAPGLRTTRNTAAEIELFIRTFSGDIIADSRGLYFVNWNEWININAVFDCWLDPLDDDGSKKNAFLSFGVDHTRTYFAVDDYNIQSAYIGQKFFPELELEIEAAGMYTTNSTHTVKRIF